MIMLSCNGIEEITRNISASAQSPSWHKLDNFGQVIRHVPESAKQRKRKKAS